MAGSGLFTNKRFRIPHLREGGHGVSDEVKNLRLDLLAEFAPMAALSVVEFTAPVASGAGDLEAATATVTTARTATLLAPGLAKLAAFPRNIVFTTAGTTPADAPANAVITGTDINGAKQTETVALAQTATTAASVKAFKTITSIVYAVGDGTGATVAISVGNVFGLTVAPKARAGLALVLHEIVDGAVVATGTVSATNSTYTPATAPNGSHNYAIYYEYNPASILDK